VWWQGLQGTDQMPVSVHLHEGERLLLAVFVVAHTNYDG
jgi:hypothetical protein